jgi:hypothetical protein
MLSRGCVFGDAFKALQREFDGARRALRINASLIVLHIIVCPPAFSGLK